MPTTRQQEYAEQPASGQTLLACTAVAIGAADRLPQFDESQWNTLFEQACRHNIAALIAGCMPAHAAEIPLTPKLKFATIESQARRSFDRMCSVTAQLLHLFNGHGIETMLLKGLALCRLYADPALRTFTDIDIYQFGRFRQADALVAQKWGIKIDNRTLHHTKYVVDGITVENHYDFVSRYGAWGNRRNESWLKREALQGRVQFAVGGEKCLLPPPDLTALFLMRHMANHFAAETVTLRHLVDWTLFCRTETPDWEHVAAVIKRMGMAPFALSIEEICSIWLGCGRHIGSALHASAPAEQSSKVLTELLTGQELHRLPDESHPMARIQGKWKRVVQSRWKHDMCYPAPWLLDLPCMIGAKLAKPHTILH